jgi:hypothetical protein
MHEKDPLGSFEKSRGISNSNSGWSESLDLNGATAVIRISIMLIEGRKPFLSRKSPND